MIPNCIPNIYAYVHSKYSSHSWTKKSLSAADRNYYTKSQLVKTQRSADHGIQPQWIPIQHSLHVRLSEHLGRGRKSIIARGIVVLQECRRDFQWRVSATMKTRENEAWRGEVRVCRHSFGPRPTVSRIPSFMHQFLFLLLTFIWTVYFHSTENILANTRDAGHSLST